MRRKVIQIADSTQLVSLPRKWCKLQNIKKGDELNVEEKGSKVIITTESKFDIEKTDIDVSDLGVMGRRTVAAAYKAGFDELRIKYSTTEELKAIQDVIKDSCIGFEVVEQGKNYILVRKISDAIFGEFDVVLRRSFLFLISLAKDGLDAIQRQDKNTLNNIILMDLNLNKFTDFCRRILNKQGHPKFKRAAPVYHIIEMLEKIGDEYKEIHKFFVQNPFKPNKDLVQLYMQINKFVEDFYELFYKFDTDKLKKFNTSKDHVDKLLLEAIPKTKKEHLPVIHRLSNVTARTFDLNGALLATNL